MNKLAFVVLILLPGMGCLNIQPVGPLAGSLPGAAPTASPAPEGKTPAAKDVAAKPVVQPAPAPAPAPPALLVTPAEVTEENYKESVRRLMDELEADRKSMDAMPRPAEISVIKK